MCVRRSYPHLKHQYLILTRPKYGFLKSNRFLGFRVGSESYVGLLVLQLNQPDGILDRNKIIIYFYICVLQMYLVDTGRVVCLVN